MPFGLTNVPATFQRLMATLGMDFCVCLFGWSINSAKVHCWTCEKANLKLKPQKYKFAQQRIEYLGCTLNCWWSLHRKVQAVKEFPRPCTVKEVNGYLGLVNYYRKHLKNLAIVARPLTALTRKKIPTTQLDWTSECEEAFTKVKELVTLASILLPLICQNHFFCLQMPVKGFGAVLEQEEDDQNCLCKSADKPCSTKVCTHWAGGSHSSVCSRPLWSVPPRQESHRLHRPSSSCNSISDTPYILRARQGDYWLDGTWSLCSRCQNAAADALSRAPAKNYDVCVISASDEQNEALIRAQAEQRKDGELSQIINYLEGKSCTV